MAQYLNMSHNGQVLIKWNITRILEELNKTPTPVKYYNVDYLASKFFDSVDIDYAMNTDITIPCIIALVEGDKEKLLDGNHRLYKAKTLKIAKIPCYVLPIEFHKKFIEDYDEELYNKGISLTL
ncbi:MAG: hypothetical protein FWD71_14425 [Oscillospiraceae bacterium]|nr:hypothetical protein [Oscillospiraceae bacterium]